MEQDFLKQLVRLEKLSSALDPEANRRDVLTDSVTKHANQFLDFLKEDHSKAFYASKDEDESQVEKSTPATKKISPDVSITDAPLPLEKTLEVFRKNVEQRGLVESHGGHLAYINSGGLYMAALADYLADVVNPYSAVHHDSPGSVTIENAVIAWIGEQLGYTEGFAGNLTSGGSASTLIALHAARNSKKIKASDFHRSVVYLTSLTHHCALKSLNTIGMDECIKRIIPYDDHFRMNTTDLEIAIQNDIKSKNLPFVIVATAGTTDLGSIDSLDEIASIAQRYNVWFHVDGCYGGFFILSDLVASSFSGIEKADSVAVDPHKSLFMPYGCGALLVKDGSKLLLSNYTKEYSASYLEDSFVEEEEDISPCNLSFELSRPFRAMKIWLPLKTIGLQPFRAALTEKIMLARYLYEKLTDRKTYELGPYPQLSVVAFRFTGLSSSDQEMFNRLLLDSIMKDGRVALASTRIKNVYFLRICILCFRTHREEIDRLLSLLDSNSKTLLAGIEYQRG